MEMNFPHKKLDRTVLDGSVGVAARVADHQTLLAHAIARQSASQSARYYSAARAGLPVPQAGGVASFMDNRMAYFAGRIRSGIQGHQKDILFQTGCFRPDLTHQDANDMHR